MVTNENDLLLPPPPPSRKTGHIKQLLLIACLAIIGAGVVVAVYMTGRAEENKVTAQNKALTVQINSLQKKTKQQSDINAGAASAKQVYNDPKGGIALLDGAVTFTLPEGWERTSINRCAPGTRDSTVLCVDTAAITGGNDTPTINIGVFERKQNSGSAKDWFEQEYYGPLSTFNIPTPSNISTEPISGYNAMSFSMVSGPEPTPAYVEAFYTIVHDKHAVVVRSYLEDGSKGATHTTYIGKPYDYRQQYGPILKQFAESIKFKE